MVREPVAEPRAVEPVQASLLVVEDDDILARGLRAALEQAGFHVRHVESAESALSELERRRPDLVLLDIMLPRMDGLSLLRNVKADHPELPIILVTSKSTEIDRVLGLELGADDYVVKPFSLREIVARVRCRLRRPVEAPRTPDRLTFGSNEVDLKRRLLWHNGVEDRLTTHQAWLLAYLVTNRGREVSREDILEHVWGYPRTMATRTVDNQVVKLRKKVEDNPSDPRHILTVHGTGYRFED